MFELVHGREATIDRCAAIGGLMKVVVLEVGDKLGGRGAPRQQDRHPSASPLCSQGQGMGLWL